MRITTRILQKSAALRVAKPTQQFGQADSSYTAGGATGCTQTVLQYLALLWTGKWHSHNEISKMVGYPNMSLLPSAKRRGMVPAEVSAFIKKVGIPYTVVFDWPIEKVIAASQLAPVGIAVAYGWVPEWKGFRYKGIVSDGKPNDYARPLGKAGKTQLSGFSGGHMSVFLGTAVQDNCTDAIRLYWEPNHGSALRPEKPPFDEISPLQLKNVYESYHKVLGRRLYAIVPTKALPV